MINFEDIMGLQVVTSSAKIIGEVKGEKLTPRLGR